MPTLRYLNFIKGTFIMLLRSALIIVILCGCQTKQVALPYLQLSSAEAKALLAHQKNSLVQAGKSAPYVRGYLDGCRTGYRTVGFTSFKPRKQESVIKQYQLGWRTGYQICQKAAYERRDQKRHLYLKTMQSENNENILIWESLKK